MVLTNGRHAAESNGDGMDVGKEPFPVGGTLASSEGWSGPRAEGVEAGMGVGGTAHCPPR